MFTIVFARSNDERGRFRIDRRRAERLADLTHHHCRVQAVPRNVADRDRDAAIGEFECVVPVAAADRILRAGAIGGVVEHVLVGRESLGEQCALERIGDEVLACVGTGAIDRKRRSQRELFEKNDLGGIEAADARDAQNAEELLARDPRNIDGQRRFARMRGKAALDIASVSQRDKARRLLFDEGHGECVAVMGNGDRSHPGQRRGVIEGRRECFRRV